MNRCSLLKTSVAALLCVIFALGYSQPAYAVPAPSVEWQNTVACGLYQLTADIQPSLDGGYIVAGAGWNSGSVDVHLVKFDVESRRQWEKTFGGSGDDYASAIRATADGGFIITGSTTSYDAVFGGIYLLKVDRNGFREWERAIGLKGVAAAYARSLIATGDGGFIVAGSIPAGTGTAGGFLAKSGADGSLVWETRMDGVSGESVAADSDGGFVIAGKAVAPGGGCYPAVVKADSEGKVTWKQVLNGLSGVGSFVYREADGYILAGVRDTFETGVFLAKLNPVGKQVWIKETGVSYLGTIISINRNSDGGFIFGGYTSDETGGFMLIRVNREGNSVWQRIINGDGNIYGGIVKQTGDRGYVVAGNDYQHLPPGVAGQTFPGSDGTNSTNPTGLSQPYFGLGLSGQPAGSIIFIAKLAPEEQTYEIGTTSDGRDTFKKLFLDAIGRVNNVNYCDGARAAGYVRNFVYGWYQPLTREPDQWEWLRGAIMYKELSRTPPKAYVVHGDIWAFYKNAGGPQGYLGYPVSDEYESPEGNRQDFEGGSIIWVAGRGVQEYMILQVPVFKQGEPAFRGTLGYGPDTMAQSGCGVTALAMVFNYFGGSTNPLALNERLMEVGGFSKGTALLTWSPSSVYMACYGIAEETLNMKSAHLSWRDRWSIIDEELRMRHPVIVKLSLDNDITGHYVVVTGKKAGRYCINDPGSGKQGIYLEENCLSVPGKVVSIDKIVQVITFHDVRKR